MYLKFKNNTIELETKADNHQDCGLGSISKNVNLNGTFEKKSDINNSLYTIYNGNGEKGNFIEEYKLKPTYIISGLKGEVYICLLGYFIIGIFTIRLFISIFYPIFNLLSKVFYILKVPFSILFLYSKKVFSKLEDVEKNLKK